MMRRIAIVGFAPSSREMANDEPATTEIWGLNKAHEFLKRADRWFQIHPRDWRGDENGFYGRNEDHLKFLQGFNGPVFMLAPDERIPKWVIYPRAAVVKRIGRDYLTSSFAYAAALAIHEGVDEIAMYGCDLAVQLEFYYQRPCLEWLLGLAEGRGIKVDVRGSPLLQGVPYPDDAGMRKNEERVIKAKNEYMKFWQGFAYGVGRLQQAQKDGSAQVEHIEAALGAIVANIHVSGGMLKEATQRLIEGGTADFTAAYVPRLVTPPNMIDTPPVDEATAVEQPA